MSDIELDGHQYRCGKMPTRTQLHVAIKLAPVMEGLTPLVLMDADFNDPRIVFQAVSALTNTLGLMKLEDADFVVDAALQAVRWSQNGRWVPLVAPGGVLLNGAADRLDVQLRLLWEVLRESLANFSPEIVLPWMQRNGLDQTALEMSN